MSSMKNQELEKSLKELNILIVPKNIAVYSDNDKNEITELYLSRHGIKEIPKDFFDKPIFHNLQKLYLNSNKITELPDRIFSSLKHLQYLNLSRNYVTKVKNESFFQLQELTELDFSNNTIDSIDDQAFQFSKKLTSINLKNNNLEQLPPNLFTELDHLEKLDLSINKLRFLPKTLISLKADIYLSFLDLKSNYIPYEFAKTYITGPVIHSFLSELQEYYKTEKEKITINEIDKIVKQYLFDALMSVYHYSVNIPVLTHSLLGITLGYMTKNFHLLANYIEQQKNDLTFRQTLFLWEMCLNFFKPVEESLLELLQSTEEGNERQRRIIERKQKLLTDLEKEILEYGGVMDYKFKKSDIKEIELEPVHKNLFNLMKKFLDWNTPQYSTIFL